MMSIAFATAALASYTTTVAPGGGLEITLAGQSTPSFKLGSTFSEAGSPPLLHEFNSVRADGATLQGDAFTVERQYHFEPHRVVVHDHITANKKNGAALVGIEINHNVSIDGRVAEATVPGALYPFACTSRNPDEAGSKLHRGTFGNPSVHAATADGKGVALLALDDVLEQQGYLWQQALPRYPRMPKATPSCPVSDPPTVGLTDSNFALAPGDSYQMEWAVYLLYGSCTDYYCFVNKARDDLGVSNITIRGAGYLSMYQPDREPFWTQAGYKYDWSHMSISELKSFIQHQGLSILQGAIPESGHTETCRPKVAHNCHGSCFVHALPESQVDYYHKLLNMTAKAAPGMPRLMYVDTLLTGERNAVTKYKDSTVTDATGRVVTYERCAAGVDYPMMFSNGTNSYSAELVAYYEKLLAFGFDGVYHDEFMCSSVAYTFSVYDGRSAVLDPVTKEVKAPLGNVALMTQANEISLIQKIRDANGVMVFNGAPSTRTVRTYASTGNHGSRIAGGPAGASLHFVESSEETRMMWTHLFTPIALTRYGGQRKDLDPKYNSTCRAPLTLSDCLGRDVYDHLDYGVLPYLYDGLFSNSTNETILTRLYPITPLALRPGLVSAKERTVTKLSGVTVDAPPDAKGGAYAVYVYLFGQLVGGGPRQKGSGAKVAIGALAEGEIAVVVPAGEE